MSIQHVQETGSTNADLLGAAAEGQPEGAVLIADHQTAGRGRQDRRWHDEPQNAVLMSVLLRPAAELVPLVPLLSGVAVVDAIEQLATAATDTGGPGPTGSMLTGLKWPNDVLAPTLAERKLAGILAEATPVAGVTGDLAVVVGIGLNLRWSSAPPAEIAASAATLAELLGCDVERFVVAGAILGELDRCLTHATTGGRQWVLDTYRPRCLTLGRQVRMQTPSGVVEGTACDLAADGALVISGRAGTVTVRAGDAHHL